MLQEAGVRPALDLEKFRLRTFVEHLRRIGELEVHEEPVTMADLSAAIESTPKATLFSAAGPERFELVAAVSGEPEPACGGGACLTEKTLFPKSFGPKTG